MHEVLVNHLGGQSLPRKSVVRLTDHPDMTLDVYRENKTTAKQRNISGAQALPQFQIRRGNRDNFGIIFPVFSINTHINCLVNTVLMRDHNLYFY